MGVMVSAYIRAIFHLSIYSLTEARIRWYADVHQSKGWKTAVPDRDTNTARYRTLDPRLSPALLASFPAYEFLRRLTKGYQTRGPPPEQIYEDPRNSSLLVWIGAPGKGQLYPRDMASVSPWDSSVQGGDAAWEGIRVTRGKILLLEKHLRRLFKSAKALGFENVHSAEEVTEAISRTLAANGMRDGAHMRLTLTVGRMHGLLGACALLQYRSLSIFASHREARNAPVV